ncbi:hypothetical protein CCR75_005028 [Bremia lactucae]|uniref:Cupin-like domain-containing protein n=1 Tax=Bremia lactucae TaxID=4779 RepID=A0A976FN41_BRELC|nr:hypothetical protein CCR75_005028 [Bremia lactucae]
MIAAQVVAAGFVRRGAWKLRQCYCGRATAVLLLLLGVVVLSSMLLEELASTLLHFFQNKFELSGSANALRWGYDSTVIELKGQPLQRILPSQYPNGAANKFLCDLPSLRFQCDLDKELGCKAYPQLFPSAALFENWKPESTKHVPATIFNSLCHFNVSDHNEFRLAQVFREMEVPFVTYGIPELTAASERWTDEYLMKQLRATAQFKVHVANDSHFMYFTKDKRLPGEKATYESRQMTYPQFVQTIGSVTSQENAGRPHEYYYFMIKKSDFDSRAAFIYRELPFLDPTRKGHDRKFGDLYIRDSEEAGKRGMRCRFGMRGIIADGHIDGGFNQISIIRGTKRYVIAPPSACNCLGLRIEGQSARHTVYNWSDTSVLSEDARNCPAAEVALTSGEVLYLPSYWYHHIVSLDTSIQCNLRSGVSVRNETRQFLAACGFNYK